MILAKVLCGFNKLLVIAIYDAIGNVYSPYEWDVFVIKEILQLENLKLVLVYVINNVFKLMNVGY